MDDFQKQLRLKRNPVFARLLTNDELKPRSPSKFAGYERLKVGHKRIWLRRSVVDSRRYHPLNKPATKDTRSRYFAVSPLY
jgi:hypothetical protein